MKTLFIVLGTLLLSTINNAQNKITMSDLEPLNNSEWTGMLTYLDYQSNKLVDIETTLQIKIKDNKVISNMQYIYEPKKNNKSVVKINKNGTYYGNEKIVSNLLENNERIITTTYDGLDDSKKARIFITHTFTDKIYTVSKKVIFKASGDSLIRNTYKFKKI